eukprot:3472319-Prymnesium_polylepis.1
MPSAGKPSKVSFPLALATTLRRADAPPSGSTDGDASPPSTDGPWRGVSRPEVNPVSRRESAKVSSISCCWSLRDTSCRCSSRRCWRLILRSSARALGSFVDSGRRRPAPGMPPPSSRRVSTCFRAASNSLRSAAIAPACAIGGDASGSSVESNGGGP